MCLRLLFIFAGRAFTFSGEGHQIVATIAAEKMKGTRAEHGIATLLALTEVPTWADRLKRRAFDEEPATFRPRNPGRDRYHYMSATFQIAL